MAKSKKRRKTLSPYGDKTSEREKALIKPLKPSKKFSTLKSGARCSGLSIHKKTSLVKASPQPLVDARAASAVGVTRVMLDRNKSLYLVFVGWFFSASWTTFTAARTVAS
jgi:hypothetical protein